MTWRAIPIENANSDSTMQVATPRKLVLPPIGPLFASHRAYSVDADHHMTDFHHSNLRTPTGVHAVSSFDAGFPTSSPVRKEKPSMKDFDSFKLDVSSSPMGSDSPSDISGGLDGEDEEKLRLSRERNRLHAQRTRIRKRELLENLKDRIAGMQGEYALLKQAYDSHVTAMYLLSLCDESAHLSIQGLDDISDLADASQDVSQVVCVNDEDVDAAAAASGQTSLILHDKSCQYYHMDPDDEGSGYEEASCACMDRHADTPLNANGKRPHSNSISLMTCSKEEREQIRRERNRLHARRARLRKKLMLEKSQQAVQKLRARNELLRARLSILVASIYDGRQPMLPPILETA